MPSFSFFELIGLICLMQIIVYVVFLLRSHYDQSTNYLLAFLLTLAILLINLLIRTRWNPDFPYFYFEYVAVLSPTLYLYSQSLTRKEFSFSKSLLYHYAGFVIVALLHFIMISLVQWEATTFERFFTIPLFFYAYVYLYLTWRHINRYHEVILQTTSEFGRYNLKWFKTELWVLCVFFALFGLESILLFFELNELYLLVISLGFLSMLFFINLITFKSLRAPFQVTKVTAEDLAGLNAKYAGSSLGQDQSQEHFELLKQILIAERPYKEFRLTLKELAAKTGLSASVLSQVINENAQMNFNDFINSHRVAEARELMAKHPDWLIKEVMYESGFQSTSTFHSAFVKHSRQSPSAYKKQLQAEQRSNLG